MAGGAGAVHAGEKEEFDADEAFAGAGFAAALGYVEGEAAGVVFARPRELGGGEEFADVVEEASVGGHVRARGAADGFLVDDDEAADVLHAGGDLAASGNDRVVFELVGFVFFDLDLLAEVFRYEFDEDLADERGFAGAGDAGDGGEDAEGNLRVEMVKVVARDAAEFEPAFGSRRGACDGAVEGKR